jgi:hypothetical protein
VPSPRTWTANLASNPKKSSGFTPFKKSDSFFFPQLESMSDPSSVDPLTLAIQQVERPYALKVLALCSSPHSAHDSTRTAPVGSWRDVCELEYIGPTHPSAAMWNDFSIITYLVHTAISIPPRSDSRSDPWVTITSNDSGTTTLPRGYRVPLLWLAKVQWESLKLLLTVARPLWDTIKFDLLYIARLTTQFLAKARNEVRMKRQWRDPMFDRAMTRFFNGWMGCRDVFMWDFYREFKNEEYKDDVLARSAFFLSSSKYPASPFSAQDGRRRFPKASKASL